MIFPFWLKLALPVALFASGAVTGCHLKGVKDAEKIGAMEAEVKSVEAVLAEVKAQQDDFKKQRDLAQQAAAKMPAVVTQWMRDTNAAPIAPGCEAAMGFQRARAPILSAHRVQVIQ